LNTKTQGQTVIETVMMLLVLLMIFFLIAEFSRAWYLKNSLNNAVRRAVRTAVVTPNLTPITNASCPMPSNSIVNAVCTSPGVPNTSTTKVTVKVITDTPPAGISTGDIIEVNVRAGFNTVVPALLPFMPKSAYSAAAMRYE